MTNSKDWKKFDIASQCENQPTTKQLFKDLEQDALSIIGCSTNLIEAIKERDKKILDLELQLETINRPLKK